MTFLLGLLIEKWLEFIQLCVITKIGWWVRHVFHYQSHKLFFIICFKSIVINLLSAQTAEITLTDRFSTSRARAMSRVYPDIIIKRLQLLQRIIEHFSQVLSSQVSLDCKIRSANLVQKHSISGEDSISFSLIIDQNKTAAFFSMSRSVPAFKKHLPKTDSFLIFHGHDSVSGDGAGSHEDLAIILLLQLMLSRNVISMIV